MRKSKEMFWVGSIAFLILATLIVLNFITLADADLWGHLRFGLDNLASRSLIQVDPYSYLSAGQRWINHEWLAEVFFGLAWLAGGSTGLILLKTIVGILTLGLVYWYLLSQDVPPVRAGILVILGWLGILTAIATVRPHMFTLLFSAITFIIISFAEKGKYHRLWAAPPVFMLWINFHGGVLAGLGFLSIWTVLHLILHRQEWRKILPPVLLSYVALLINPYGIDLITFLFRTATVPRPEIVEWQPLNPITILGGIYFVLLTITILGLVFSKLEKRLPKLVLLGVAAILPFVAFRHLPLFSLAVLVFGGEHISDAMSRVSRSPKTGSQRPLWLSVFSILVGIALLIWGYSNFQHIRIPHDPVPFFPDKAVVLLQESQIAGNLAVEFNWGQYVIWHLGPKIKVSVDGRRETVYSDEIYNQNFDFLRGRNEWDGLLDHHPTDMALVYQSQAAYNLLSLKDSWELVYEDATSALFARRNWSEFENLIKIGDVYDPGPDNEYFP